MSFSLPMIIPSVPMTVPFSDLGAAHAELRDELDAVWHRVLGSSGFILGDEVAAFEHDFAALCGTEHAIGVGSGVEALHLILRGYDIGPGDEVIVPGHTFIATWLSVSYAGATPVPVDVQEKTGNLDPALVEAAISPNTRAIVPVHLYGHPAEMDALSTIAVAHELHLIEDAAQAHGARLDGRRVGGLGDAAAFSFYPGKNLGALGDGGAITTDDAPLAQRIRLLRNYGSPAKYVHDVQGFNSRLDGLQAALLAVKLKTLEEWNARRGAVAAYYLEELAGLDGLVLPQVADDVDAVWHLFVVRHADRDALKDALAERGVQTLIHYPVAPHHTGAYSAIDAELPVSERFAAEVLSLPMGPHLSAEQQEHVVSAVRAALAG